MAYQEILASDSPNEGRAKINAQTEELYSLSGATGLDGLSDVDTTTTPPTDGQALLFDEASGLWLPGTVAGGLTEVPAEYVTQDEGDARYVRISGDPADGDYFEWDEALGMLVPTAAPSGGGGGATAMKGFRATIPSASDVAATPGGGLSPFSGESYDTDGWFNNTSSAVGGIPAYSFRPGAAGYYTLAAEVDFYLPTASYTYYLNLRKNGVVVLRRTISVTIAYAVYHATIFDTLYANGSTDYFDVSLTGSSGVTPSYAAPANSSLFAGRSVGT